MATLDTLVLPSHTENLPQVIMEGMAGRLPVVATRVGGIPEMVSDGHEGLLVDSHDPRGLGEAVIRLADAGLGRRLGDAGRRRVAAEFSVEAMIDRHVNLYETWLTRSTLGSGNPPSPRGEPKPRDVCRSCRGEC